MHYLNIYKPFILHANCFLVNGFQRSLIIDTLLEKYYFIPNFLSQILIDFRGKTIFDIREKYNNEYDETLNEYFYFLIENELIYFTDNPNSFPLIDLDYKIASSITNVIIDLVEGIDYSEFVKQIDELGCKAVVLNCTNHGDLSLALKTLTFFSKSGISHIEIYLNQDSSIDDLKLVFFEENRLQRVILFNSNKNLYYPLENGMGKEIIYTKKNKEQNQSCIITPNLFSINLSTFTESQKYHTYFNRKLYVGQKGVIKNAPECEEEFGFIQNIKNTEDLKKIVFNPEFQKYWKINKEMIDICKDCEFRHVCVESLLPYNHKNGSYYHKETCGYNPYIVLWKGQEGWISVEQ